MERGRRSRDRGSERWRSSCSAASPSPWVCRGGAAEGGVSLETRDALMLAISLLAAVASLCLYVPAVRNRAWAAVWAFRISLFVFGIAAVVLFARLLWETA
jgi:hypothetical protein